MDLIMNVITTGLIICLVMNNISPYKIEIIDYVKMIIISIVLGSIVNLFIPDLVPLFIFIVPIYIFYLKSKKLIFSIILAFTGVIISVISDYIVSFILIGVLRVDFLFVYELSQLILMALIGIVSYTISFIIGKFIKSNIQFIKAGSSIKIISLVLFTVIMTFIIIYLNLTISNYRGFSSEMIIINGMFFFSYFLIMIITIFIAFKLLNKEFESKNKQEQLENLQAYSRSLEESYFDMRKFRHDYVNIISSIIGYIDDKDLDGLEEHVYTNIIPLSKKFERNNTKIDRLKYLMIPEIKGIVAIKLLRAQNLGIDVYIDIVEEITNINIDIIDLSRIIGIILDNAIEGAVESKEKSMKVSFIKKDDSVIILVINSCTSNMEPIFKLYEQGYSTKGDNRGLGLGNLREILNKYSNTIIDTMIENEEFIQNIEVFNNQ